MNIYALKGYRVSVSDESIESGSESDSKLAKLHLKSGSIYRVEKTSVYNSYTSVSLQEIDNVLFSSESFIDIDSQTEKTDKKHPDWPTWNTEEGYEAYLKEN
jgi:hypothetical protein